MHNLNLKMIKIILVIAIGCVVFTMVNGITILKNNYYWRTPYLKMQTDYLKTELAFINYNYGGIINWLTANKKNATPASEKSKSVPILLYHGIIENPDWQPDDVSIRLADFRDQLFALKKAGWQTISLSDYLAFSQGKKSLPEKSFMITFDDGRKDSFYPVDPILRVLGYSAVMNVITGRSLGLGNETSSFHLSQNELEKMIESGRWEMASHTQNGHDYEKISEDGQEGHFLSDKLWLASQKRLETDDEYKKRVYSDLLNSKKDLEKKLGVKVLAFAFPFGDFGQASNNFPASKDILAGITSSIFNLSFYQIGVSDFPTNYPENSYLAKRINVTSPMGGNELLKMLADNKDKPINYTDNFSMDNGWLKGWGISKIDKNTLTISDSPTEDSGLTFLSGTYLWSDYYAEARISLVKGSGFAITARYKDENNYVTCDFSDTHMALTQRVDKIDKPDIEVDQIFNFSSRNNFIAGIYVYGNQASCFLDGQEIVTGAIENGLTHGGISFKIWDFDKNIKGSTVVIKNLKVSPAPAVN